MNKKNKPAMKPITYVPIAVLAVAAVLGAGYMLGSKSDPAAQQGDTQQQTEDTNRPDQSNNKPNPTQTTRTKPMTTPSPTQKRAITPEAIAKAKNVPATLSNPQGDFTLVAVIEGEAANRKLNQSLQIVGAQRQRLALLSRQFDQTPAASVQQRELIAGQINETRKTLEGNLRFMAQNYAYSLNNNYVLVPHEAALLSVTEEDGKAKAEVVYEFKNSGSYEDFQKKRDAYLRLKLEQAKAAQEAAKKEGQEAPAAVLVEDGEAKPADAAAVPEADPVAEQPAKLELTPEMKEKQKELLELYKYDPEKNYQVNFEKTALYARAAR